MRNKSKHHRLQIATTGFAQFACVHCHSPIRAFASPSKTGYDKWQWEYDVVSLGCRLLAYTTKPNKIDEHTVNGCDDVSNRFHCKNNHIAEM